MSRIHNWEQVLEVIRNRLVLWKAKLLSIGGRLTLIKSVLESLPVYYLSLYKAPKAVLESIESIMRRFLWAGSSEEKKIPCVAWDIVTTPKNKGGLGVVKLQDVNTALLLKWTWRFKRGGNCMWKSIIMGCHGASRPWALLPCSASSTGCWKHIVKIGEQKLSNGSALNSFFSGKLGDGNSLSFWGDAWLTDDPLRIVYPNLFRIEKNKWAKVSERIKMVNNLKTLQWEWKSYPSSAAEVTELFQLLNDIHDISWSGGPDSWIWKPAGDGVFCVKSAKTLLQSFYVDIQTPKINWKVWVPTKCKIMVWRAALNRLPTTTELIKRGVNLSQSCCTFCHVASETACHIFTGCLYSQEVWNRIEAWCRLAPNILFDISDILHMPENQSLNKKARGMLRGIIYTTMWAIWIERNNRIFSSKQRKPIEIVENINARLSFGFVIGLDGKTLSGLVGICILWIDLYFGRLVGP